MLKKTIMCVAVAGLLLALVPAAPADLISSPGGFAAPEDLNLGDTYKLIFITSTIHDAVSNDINTYNDFVQGLADTAGIGNTAGVEWKALASTWTHGWLNNVGAHDKVYLLDGQKVWEAGFAPKYPDFMSQHYTGLLTAIDITEEGTEIGPVDVWTGSHANGEEWGSGLGWEGDDPPYGGTTGVGVNTLYTGYQWLLEAYGGQIFIDWTIERYFYGMSEQLEVVSSSTAMDLYGEGSTGEWKDTSDPFDGNKWSTAPSGSEHLAPTAGMNMFIEDNDSVVNVTAHFTTGDPGLAASVTVGNDGGTSNATLVIDSPFELGVDGLVDIKTGATLTVNGTLKADTSTTSVDGTLNGNGTILSTVEVGGALAPGNSIGELSVTGAVTVDGKMVAELSGSDAHVVGINNDHLNVTGAATLTGSTLDIVWNPGEANDGLFGGTYTVVTGTSVDAAPSMGTFTTGYGATVSAAYIQAGPTKVGNTVTVELKNVLVGDANLDGDVDYSQLGFQGDVQIILENLPTAAGANWGMGDSNHDDDVDYSQLGCLGDVQLILANLPSSLDVGHDVGAQQAELVYDETTGEVWFDVGAEIGNIAMYSLEIFGGAAGNLFTHEPIFGDDGSPPYDILSYSDMGGLSVGEDSVGIVLPAGLTEADIIFEVSPIGAAGFLGSVTIIPEPSALVLAVLGLLGLALYGWRRKK